jgi:hypothetical protein
MGKLFKVRDKVTGKFWNGDVRRTAFVDKGKSWNKRSSVESSISHLIRWRARWGEVMTNVVPESWEIVEIELRETETGTSDIAEFIRFSLVRAEACKVSSAAGAFMDAMYKKGVINDVEFIMELKPAEGSWRVDRERIKEARAHMRQLGVKTRTFREQGGMFGMMDRPQALKARLLLDCKNVIDLGSIRKQLFS